MYQGTRFVSIVWLVSTPESTFVATYTSVYTTCRNCGTTTAVDYCVGNDHLLLQPVDILQVCSFFLNVFSLVYILCVAASSNERMFILRVRVSFCSIAIRSRFSSIAINGPLPLAESRLAANRSWLPGGKSTVGNEKAWATVARSPMAYLWPTYGLPLAELYGTHYVRKYKDCLDDHVIAQMDLKCRDRGILVYRDTDWVKRTPYCIPGIAYWTTRGLNGKGHSQVHHGNLRCSWIFVVPGCIRRLLVRIQYTRCLLPFPPCSIPIPRADGVYY